MLVPNHHPEPVVAYGETNPQYFKLNNANLCTIDITNVYYSDCSNHSDIYHVYLHKKNPAEVPRLLFLKEAQFERSHGPDSMSLFPCWPIWILSTMQLHIVFSIIEHYHIAKIQSKRVHSNYVQDYTAWLNMV